MSEHCEKWKDALREAALTGARTPEVEEHLRICRGCSEELRRLATAKAKLDALLPQLARGAELSADFPARINAAVEAATKQKQIPRWRVWTLAGTIATIVIVTVAVWHGRTATKIESEELAAAQKLAEWRAPTDTLLTTSGEEMLRTTPKLGESYLRVPIKKVEEEE
jgi:predicted anti-sigma-YlaC factor YlaD